MVDEVLNLNPSIRTAYEDIIKDYNFTDGIPKDNLFVKLSPDISDYRREYIANGIRSYFRDDTTILIDRKQVLASINQSLTLF